ncbi:protein translocase subunit SecD [Malaciobacter molluscorum LMG 25693]|uniref:Protein translocase subunit SecD n=1 Tax=Malaciobacter molluscorum LMG 25693 TaxID=870501 RepID=A0A2G1DGC5_9BACT|nr:protein translocase subunit SecD [Malaciobacter molluscorum]AXX91459.1 protein-export membrane protein SecD [Malaciobacter molluscorum LMG 25693]PHO17545.1 protein translocase subunit SecD [Malaciobacter molluscorum LMG 25693]RXJ93358.1 protein translocase subunit SecD [Malaciobacter molluscorum]
MKILNYRLVIFILSIIFGIVFSLPSFMQTDTGKKISLGLDLQGGLHMLLGVQTNEAVTSKIKSIATSIKYFADDEDLLLEDLSIDNDTITFSMLDKDELPKIEKSLEQISGLKISVDGLNVTVSLTDKEIERTKDLSVSQAVETIRNRLDQFGLAEPTVIRQGKTDIVVQLPGIKSQEDEKSARELISKPANLELMAVDEERADRVYTMSEAQAAEYGDLILEDTNDSNRLYLVKEIPILNGEQVIDAKVAFDKSNQPIINFTLNSSGARIFGDFTAKNVGKRLAVVLDGKVYSAPSIRERIGGGSGQISGGFTVQEAGNVAIALRSGALPASVKLLEKRSVGPSLGADSIEASMMALILGFALVVVFMVVYYRRAGVIANIALVTNIFIIVAVMAMFGATLTLPGMAGIVLTVGMAVDANVIITERIRELLKQGMSIPKAVEDGYSNAMRAILDANITTILAAVILYAYGTGPIKGFAVTISIGILASMLTAILGTHGIYDALMPKISKDKNTKKWFGVN